MLTVYLVMFTFRMMVLRMWQSWEDTVFSQEARYFFFFSYCYHFMMPSDIKYDANILWIFRFASCLRNNCIPLRSMVCTWMILDINIPNLPVLNMFPRLMLSWEMNSFRKCTVRPLDWTKMKIRIRWQTADLYVSFFILAVNTLLDVFTSCAFYFLHQ